MKEKLRNNVQILKSGKKMKQLFRIFDYRYNYKNVNDSSTANVTSFFFIIFGVPLLNIGIRLFYKLIFDSEWGAPSPQSKEVFFFDMILLFEFFIALILVSKIKSQFLNFYLKFYPSIKLLVSIYSIIAFYIVYFLGLQIRINYEYSTWIIIFSILLLYVVLFFLPLREVIKKINNA